MPAYFYITLHIIQALWAVWIAIWIVAAFYTKRTVFRQNRRMRVLFIVMTAIAVLLMQSQRIRSLFVNYMFFEYPLATCVIGCALCALGLLFSVWARFYLGRNWSGMITLKENHELIQSGPYAWVRHPIYTGVLTAIFGTLLALVPTLSGLLVMVMMTIAFALKWRGEEILMNRQFPDAYPAYKRKVPGAIIPWIL